MHDIQQVTLPGIELNRSQTIKLLCHLYSHLSAPVQVGCVSEPQTWSVLLQNGTHPTQAWTSEVTCVHVYYNTERFCGAFNFNLNSSK